MISWRRFVAKLRNFVARKHAEEDLAREVATHLTLLADDFERRGLSPVDAALEARRVYGGVEQAKQAHREERTLLWLERSVQDLRYGLRGLKRNPGFSLVAILSMALGIGATTSMFSLIYAVLLHPVPYADWQRLVYPIYLNDDQPSSPERWFSVTWPQYQQMLKAGAVEDVLGDDHRSTVITGRDIPEAVTLDYFTENVGRFFGVPALLGRNIQPSDAQTSQQQAPIVLSYDFWMRHYNGKQDVLGKTLELEHKPYNIVGVMPKDFTWEPDLYAPMSLLPSSERDVVPWMKLRPGISLARANAEIDALVHQFAKQTPQYFPERFRMHLEQIRDSIVSSAGPALVLLSAAVLMLLLIGCANCSVLLLARGMSRQGELAVRTAIGATRQRLLTQLLVEALLLALIGSLLGILLAFWMAKLIFSLFPDVFMHESIVRINLPVLAFSVALALASGLLFGLLPSLRMSVPDLARVMQATARKAAGQRGQSRPLSTLIAAQIALTTVIMGAAGVAIGGFMQMTHRKLGYNPEHVMSVPVLLHGRSYIKREARASYFKTLQQKIGAVPGVIRVALSADATPPNDGSNLPFEILGQPYAQRQYVRAGFVAPEYFSTLRIPLLKGRIWNETENARGGALAVINETFARRYFLDGKAIGRQIRTPTLTLNIGDPGQLAGVPDPGGWLEIVGIVSDSLNFGLDKAVQPAIYEPYARFMWRDTAFLIRTQGAPLASLHDVQRAILSLDPNQQIDLNAFDLSQWIEQQPEFKQQRLFSILFSLFSSLALAIALAGLYSVVSYSVAQRTNEFGIRMALGAQRAHVLWLVYRDIGVTILSGLAAGVLTFTCLQRFLAHWTQSSYSNPFIVCAAAAFFIVCGGLACTMPALRATHVEPMEAVRYE